MTEEKHIPVPFPKWNASTLIKFNDLQWSKFLKDILNNDSKWTREEKNERVDEALRWCKMIHDQCLNNELKWKKNI